MLKKTCIAVGAMLIVSTTFAAKLFTLPNQNDLSNNSDWQQTQQSIQNAQQQINQNSLAIQQNIQQQGSAFGQQIDSQISGVTPPPSSTVTMPTTSIDTSTQDSTQDSGQDQTNTQPATPPPTGLPSNDDGQNNNGSNWNYGF